MREKEKKRIDWTGGEMYIQEQKKQVDISRGGWADDATHRSAIAAFIRNDRQRAGPDKP